MFRPFVWPSSVRCVTKDGYFEIFHKCEQMHICEILNSATSNLFVTIKRRRRNSFKIRRANSNLKTGIFNIPFRLSAQFSLTGFHTKTQELNYFTLVQNPSGPRSHHCRGFIISLGHTTLGRAPLDKKSTTSRPLPDNTQHSQETDIHAPGGIRNRHPSKQAAADPRLRPRGHRNR